MLPKLDMNIPKQREQARIITLMTKAQIEEMLTADLKRSNYRSRLAHELKLSPPKNSAKTWIDAFRSDSEWFDQNRATLYEKFNGQYVTVTNSSVVDNDKDLIEITKRVRSKYGATPVLIRLVDGAIDCPLDYFMSGLRN